MGNEEALAALKEARAGIFGQQKQLQKLFDLTEAALNTPCPRCAKVRELTRKRVERSRKRGEELARAKARRKPSKKQRAEARHA